MSILTGKGFFTWKIPYCEGGNVQAIAGEAQAAGLTHVLIKVANGIYRYNAASDLPGLVAALHAVGIQAWGWQYIFGQSPALEAGVASRQAVDLGLDGFVVNAEVEFKSAARPNSRPPNGVRRTTRWPARKKTMTAPSGDSPNRSLPWTGSRKPGR